MTKNLVIANPAAGSGSARKHIPTLKKLIREYTLDADIVLTERRGHAIEIACQAASKDYENIIAAGGDGTVNEVINGLMNALHTSEQVQPRLNLGVLCIGRGNDFAGSIGIPAGLQAGVQALKSGKTHLVDIGRVYGGLFPGGRYFGNCVGVGFDAITTIQVSQLPRLGGFLSFFIAVLKTILIYYKGPTVKLTYDNMEFILPTLLVSIMNGRRLGGGFWLAPTSQPDDGLFDLCIAEQMTRSEIFRIIPHFLKGTQVTQPKIRTAQAKHIFVQALQGGLPAQTDGEILCVEGDHLEVEIYPKTLQVIVPG